MSQAQKSTGGMPVIQPKPLSLAISAALAVPAGVAVAQDGADEVSLDEIIVTARKREESLQGIPASIQAISSQTIELAGFRDMDDYARFIPSLSTVQANPGTAMVIFRGVADAQNTFIAEPAAAVYLDEQSLVLNGQPNPRMVDIAQIEALSGPQGTLYGASAQAGVLRIITNKPDLDGFSGNIDIGLKGGNDSSASYDISAVANIPLSDSFAVRLVGFSARDGGFIDNVLGVSPRFGIFDNADALVEDFNDVDHFGGRITALWLMNDKWSLSAGIIHQDTDSKGRPEHDPVAAGDLKVIRFLPEQELDFQNWTQYSLTIEGDLGFAQLVSATSYFERDWTYNQDTSTGYQNYFGSFCYNDYWVAYSKYCFQSQAIYEDWTAGGTNYNPNWTEEEYTAYHGGVHLNEVRSSLTNDAENWKFSQEFRLFHQGDTVDWVAGLFYEKSHEDWQFWAYLDGYDESHSWDNFTSGRRDYYPSAEPIPTRSPDNVNWYSDDDTDWEQWAVFGEVTVHLGDTFDITAGYRQFDRTMSKRYFVENPQYNLTNEGVLFPSSDEKDGVPKISFTWKATDDNMVYALYSEGFRPGGTNRNRGIPFFPVSYDADKLLNTEIGTKNTFAGGRVRLNATYFHMQWEDYQLEVVDPSSLVCGDTNALPAPNCGQPWQKVVANVGNATSKGLEVQMEWAASQNFSLMANAMFLDATLDEDVPDVGVSKGARLPLSPEFKASVTAHLNWEVDWFSADSAWLRLQWSFTGDMLNQVEPTTIADGPSPQLVQEAYNIGDLRFGIDHTNWSFQAYVSNITDERAELFKNPYEFDYFWGRSRVSVNRPREFGLRWIQRFGE